MKYRVKIMTRRGKALLRLFAASLALCGSPAVAAIDCDAGDYGERLEHRFDTDACLVANKELTQRVTQAVKPLGDYKGESSNPLWMNNSRKALEAYAVELANARSAAGAAGNQELAASLQSLEQELSQLVVDLAPDMTLQKLGLPSTDVSLPRLSIGYWNPIGRAPPGNLARAALVNENCIDEATPSAKCDRAFATSKATADHVYVIGNVISRMRLPLRIEILAEATTRTNRWDAYLYKTEFQFWWELALNRYLESRCPKGLHAFAAAVLSKEEHCQARARDAYGNELGFRQVPDFKAIFLHPDVGVMYLESEADGDRFKPAIVMQVFGYEWWDWEGASVKNRRRVSLVGTLADTATSKSYGYGLQIGWNEYALAVTTHGDDIALTLNVGLIGKVSSGNSKWGEKLKEALPE